MERKLVTHEREGKLKGLLKGTYLRRWVGTPEISGSEAAAHLDNEENYSSRKSAVDFARLVNIRDVLWKCRIVAHVCTGIACDIQWQLLIYERLDFFLFFAE